MKLFDMITLSKATVKTTHKFNQPYLKILGTGYFFVYYYINSKEAQIESKKMSIQPNFEIMQRMWNLLDTSIIKELYVQSLPSIKYREKIYLKKNEIEITKEYIRELILSIKKREIKIKSIL
jgi:hypothetical protein